MKVGWQFGEPLVIEEDTQSRRRLDKGRFLAMVPQDRFLGLIPIGIQANLNSYPDKENFDLFSRKGVGLFPYFGSDHVKKDKKETDDGGQLMYKDNKPRKGDGAQILHTSRKNIKMRAMLAVKKNLFKLRKEKVTKKRKEKKRKGNGGTGSISDRNRRFRTETVDFGFCKH
ncbi:hypothetical protein Q3G72_028506 [Acer saccharum]|nr:hypothetical protein Q3G72_028506 [Acer saccharum]